MCDPSPVPDAPAAPLPPTGTITFLFTDIEGSVKLWEQHAEEVMHTALARHDAVLRSVIEAHGGHVFKTVGDAVCAAFATASETLGWQCPSVVT